MRACWSILSLVNVLAMLIGVGEAARQAGAASSRRLVRREAEESLDKSHITSMKVTSKVDSRFAQTWIDSEMKNPSSENQQATFLVYLPETAFISNFTMEIDGEIQVAQVKSKEQAEEDFEEAQKQNKTAGKVSAKQDGVEIVVGMEAFEVSVSVRPDSIAKFKLAYQQLLTRRLGWYEQRISLRPNQVVDEMVVQVFVNEPQGLTQFMVVEPGSVTESSNLDTEIVQDENNINITYSVSRDRQMQMNADKGVHGDLVLKYDVQHTYSPGLVQVEGDYLVQYVSPESNSLEPLPKNIVFVVDISGSMSGEKMGQTRVAIDAILGELREVDTFMMILFDDQLEYWPSKKVPLQASAGNVQDAKRFAQTKLVANGSANINDALVAAASRLEKSEQYGSNLIVFLTNGVPTAGETAASEIIQNVVSATENKVSIFSLGFGDDLDFDLLKALSYRTGGFARRIIPGTDTVSQLTDFFQELNTPLLYDVKVVYPDNVIDKRAVSRTNFPQYFSGSELVVVGKLQDDAPNSWEAKVEAIATNSIELTEQVDSRRMTIPKAAAVAYQSGFVYKLFVYWKIKNLLKEELMTDNEVDKDGIRNYTLALALENQLVTPLTSMVIVQGDPGMDHADYEDERVEAYALAAADRSRTKPKSVDQAMSVYDSRSGPRVTASAAVLLLMALVALVLVL